MIGGGTALLGRSKGPLEAITIIGSSLSLSITVLSTHICAFIPAPAPRVVSSSHLCPLSAPTLFRSLYN